jgi:hypothetical protein
MTETVAVFSDCRESREAGADAGKQIRERIGEHPDAVIVFASSRFDYEQLLSSLQSACQPSVLVGASSAGEFTGNRRGEGTVSALAFRSSDIQVAAGLGRGVSTDRLKAAHEVVAAFRGVDGGPFPYRSALVLTDALAGHADDLVDQLTVLTAGKYQFAGGGAGDDAQFSRTHVFYGTQAFSDAVVALEVLSTKPAGIGVGHGWTPASKPFRVTAVEGARLVGLNGLPAVEAFEEHARTMRQELKRDNPLPFFLHNILGIDTGDGYRLRVPLAIDADGAVICAAEIPSGARVCIMKTTSDSAVQAAKRATQAALQRLHGHKPGAALLFDCVATRLRMGDGFAFEVDSVAAMLGGANFVGCNTYGQIARAEGQFGGFHNCTAVVMLLPA